MHWNVMKWWFSMQRTVLTLESLYMLFTGTLTQTWLKTSAASQSRVPQVSSDQTWSIPAVESIFWWETRLRTSVFCVRRVRNVCESGLPFAHVPVQTLSQTFKPVIHEVMTTDGRHWVARRCDLNAVWRGEKMTNKYVYMYIFIIAL